MAKQCIICQSSHNKIIYQDYPGFVEGSGFDIYECNNCDSHFINHASTNKELYNKIYESDNVVGYDRYHNYLQTIKEKSDPLKFLAFNEAPYYPIYQFLKNVKNKKSVKILEVGCGFGYLTYSLRKIGFNAIGLDISEGAIKVAKEYFGSYYNFGTLNELINKSSEKYDLIIATEVIEHLINPNEFLSNCLNLLNKMGKIILTTPNKDFAPSNSIWQTTLPPVHISWISKKGLQLMAKKHNLKIRFTDFSKYFPNYMNLLVKYARVRFFKIKKSEVGQNIDGILFKKDRSKMFKIFEHFFHKITIVRFVSNLIYNNVINQEITIGAIFTRE